jgi:hypothetical protein
MMFIGRLAFLKPSLLFRCKREAFEASRKAVEPPPPASVPVTLALPPDPLPRPAVTTARRLEIDVGRARTVRVGSDVDLDDLKRMIVAVESA